MANRSPGALPPLTGEALLRAAFERIATLEGRIESLEARAGQQLPGDFRFEVSADGASVKITRVSTGGSATVVGPL